MHLSTALQFLPLLSLPVVGNLIANTNEFNRLCLATVRPYEQEVEPGLFYTYHCNRWVGLTPSRYAPLAATSVHSCAQAGLANGYGTVVWAFASSTPCQAVRVASTPIFVSGALYITIRDARPPVPSVEEAQEEASTGHVDPFNPPEAKDCTAEIEEAIEANGPRDCTAEIEEAVRQNPGYCSAGVEGAIRQNPVYCSAGVAEAIRQNPAYCTAGISEAIRQNPTYCTAGISEAIRQNPGYCSAEVAEALRQKDCSAGVPDAIRQNPAYCSAQVAEALRLKDCSVEVADALRQNPADCSAEVENAFRRGQSKGETDVNEGRLVGDQSVITVQGQKFDVWYGWALGGSETSDDFRNTHPLNPTKYYTIQSCAEECLKIPTCTIATLQQNACSRKKANRALTHKGQTARQYISMTPVKA